MQPPLDAFVWRLPFPVVCWRQFPLLVVSAWWLLFSHASTINLTTKRGGKKSLVCVEEDKAKKNVEIKINSFSLHFRFVLFEKKKKILSMN